MSETTVNPTSTTGEIMARAWQALRGRWEAAIGASLVWGAFIVLQQLPAEWIGTALSALLGLAGFVVAPAFYIGISRFFLRVARRDAALRFGDLFDGFRNFGAAWSTYFWMFVYLLPGILLIFVAVFVLAWMQASTYVIFTFAFLAMIPFLIYALPYMLVLLVTADDPAIRGRQAIRRSAYLMRGNKWRIVILGLYSVGCALLGLLAAGIGLLWAGAYTYTAFAEFYDTLCREKDAQAVADAPLIEV